MGQRRWMFGSALVALVVSACGGRTAGSSGSNSLDAGPIVEPNPSPPDARPPEGPAPPPRPGCGDGTCSSGELCGVCPVDCGFCQSCGDGTCSVRETCAGCPQDCGACEACGDGVCRADEDCLSCAPDCGPCKSCGDGLCDGKTESCFACPADCGSCSGCGDGTCGANENCASCANDCGVCAVCGNGACQAPYETCANCPGDCGACETIGCAEMLTCGIGCVDTSQRPPSVRVSCIGGCVARGCPDAQFLFDQAFACIVANFEACGRDLRCYQTKCDRSIAACFAATC